ncbi:MAG TPA: exopolysaccharide biosynthesis polyprenyl glycosylphosphotransferase [Caulobacteraceae bacterium]|jgi:Undecaprenyl-phosphate glucose phosphotransferase
MSALARTADLPFEPDLAPLDLRQHARPERHEAEVKPIAEGAERRGPMRPASLAPARSRMSAPALAKAFRTADIGLMVLVAGAAFALRWSDLLSAPLGQVLPYVLGVLAAALALPAAGAYRLSTREGLTQHLTRALGAVLAAGLLTLGLAALLGGDRFDPALRAWFAATCVTTQLAHLTWWLLVRRWRAAGRLTPNVVVVGATPNAERLIQNLLDTREAAVLGVFDDRLGRSPSKLRGVPVLGDTAALMSHRIMPCVDRIVVAVPSAAQRRVRELIAQLRVLPNDVMLFLEFDSEAKGGAALARLADAPLAQVCGRPREDGSIGAKRIQDVLLGSLLFVLALPVMALVALAVRLDTPGPVLFRQRRHGFNNEEIVVWKFRSMRHEAADATAACQTHVGDNRVTRVGRLIRKTSLDELPQLLNVIRGEMSLVGPRPHAIGMKTGGAESAKLVAEYAHRHRIKPGITGWAAIKGSRGPVNTPEEVRRRVALDVEYIERQSLWLDLYIVLMTLPCLLGDRAAVR